MKRSLCRSLVQWLPLAASIALIVIALAADFIGVDADNKWGPFRIALFATGIIGLLLVMGMRAVSALDRRLLNDRRRNNGPQGSSGKIEGNKRRFRLRSLVSTPLDPFSDHPSPESFPSHRRRECASPIRPRMQSVAVPLVAARRHIPLVVLFIAVELLYVWFVSVGHMTWWPGRGHRYSQLAEAFLQGRVDLLIDPPDSLAELENPYSSVERRGIRVITDVSYFRGRYYLYWGPAPAALVALWMLVSHRAVGDPYIVFAAATLTFLFSSLIVLYLRRSYFPSLPAWLLAGSLIVLATAHPLLWVLSGPAIYEAAIVSGQAFLLAGLFFALPAIDGSDRRPWRLALAGGLWALALGSRLALAGAVAVLASGTVMALFRKGRGQDSRKAAAVGAAAFVLPFIFGLGLLGVYNYVRFGSMLETGFRFALTPVDLTSLAEKGQLFNVAHLAPNLLYYAVTPVRPISLFPLIKPVRGEWPAFSMFLRRVEVLEVHSVEDITGLLVAVPFILFAGFLIAEFAHGQDPEVAANETVPVAGDLYRASGFRRIAGALLLATVFASIPSLLYFFIASRFSLDYSPLLVIFSVMGSWLLYEASRPYPIRRALVNLLILSTIIASLVVSFLLAISGPASRFDDLNPVLWEKLIRLLSW